MKEKEDNYRMTNKVSVITVVYNDVANIRETIDSYLSQTWRDKEYIVIDGGSTDGTAEIIKSYADRLDYWCSEHDDGMYDAMNKGIQKATGDWICILNSGDTFASEDALRDALSNVNVGEIDILYGNSIEEGEGDEHIVVAGDNINKLEYRPIYRHGSSLVRTDIHKKFLFDLSKQSTIHYALDYDMIYRAYKSGCRFQKADVIIERYKKDGVSNHPYKNIIYAFKITTQDGITLMKIILLIKRIIFNVLTITPIKRIVRGILVEYGINDILPHIPFWSWRRFYLKINRMRIGKGTFIMKRNYFICPHKIEIGDYSHVNRGCILDARGGIKIGNSVSISHNVVVMTGSHDMNSSRFIAKYRPIVIEDYAWLGVGCTILQDVKIGKGAVVCAGAIVTKDVAPYAVVGGIPARQINERERNLNYKCNWDTLFT